MVTWVQHTKHLQVYVLFIPRFVFQFWNRIHDNILIIVAPAVLQFKANAIGALQLFCTLLVERIHLRHTVERKNAIRHALRQQKRGTAADRWRAQNAADDFRKRQKHIVKEDVGLQLSCIGQQLGQQRSRRWKRAQQHVWMVGMIRMEIHNIVLFVGHGMENTQ